MSDDIGSVITMGSNSMVTIETRQLMTCLDYVQECIRDAKAIN